MCAVSLHYYCLNQRENVCARSLHYYCRSHRGDGRCLFPSVEVIFPSTIPNDGQKICDSIENRYMSGRRAFCLPGQVREREMGGSFSSCFSLSAEERRARLEVALSKTKDIVASYPVVIFSSTYCPFCRRVKQLLTKLGASFKAIELDAESDSWDIHSALVKLTGQRTLPNVFIAGKHVGGHNYVMSRHKQGKLVPLLVEVGAIAAPAAA